MRFKSENSSKMRQSAGKMKMINYDSFKELYIDKNLSYKEIAEIYEVSPRTAQGWRYKYKIPSRFNTVDVDNVVFTQRQLDIIHGSLLGDGCIFKWSKYDKYALSFEHCDRQKDYLTWKGTQLNPMFVGRKMFLDDRRPQSPEWLWQSKRHNYFKVLHEKFYDVDGKKFITHDIASMLTPLALAVWYMDDGHCRPGKNAGGKICTHGFTKEENYILSGIIQSKFDVKTNVSIDKNNRTGKTYWYLSMVYNEFCKFINIVKEFVIDVECMRYKIPHILRDYMPNPENGKIEPELH